MIGFIWEEDTHEEMGCDRNL